MVPPNHQQGLSNIPEGVEERLQIHISGENSVSHSPETTMGERLLWINKTDSKCTINFDVDGCPFEGNTCKYVAAPHDFVLSQPVRGVAGRVYTYRVTFSFLKGRSGGPHLGNPQVIVK